MTPRTHLSFPIRRLPDGPGPDTARPDHSFYPMSLEEMTANERTQQFLQRHPHLKPQRKENRRHAMNAARKLSRYAGPKRPAIQVVVAYHPDHGWWIFPGSHPQDPLTERGAFYNGVFTHPSPYQTRHPESIEARRDELVGQVMRLRLTVKHSPSEETERKLDAAIDELSRLNLAWPIDEKQPSATPTWDVTVRDPRTGNDIQESIVNFSAVAAQSQALEKVSGGQIIDCIINTGEWPYHRHYQPSGDPEDSGQQVHDQATGADQLDRSPSVEDLISESEKFGFDYQSLEEHLDEAGRPVASGIE